MQIEFGEYECQVGSNVTQIQVINFKLSNLRVERFTDPFMHKGLSLIEREQVTFNERQRG